MRLASALALAALPALAVASVGVTATDASGATSVHCTGAITVRFNPALHSSPSNSGHFTGFGSASCGGTLRDAAVSGSASVASDGTRGPGICGSDQGDGTLSLSFNPGAVIANVRYTNSALAVTLSGSTPQGEQVSGRFTMPFNATAACSTSAGLAGTTISGSIDLTGG